MSIKTKIDTATRIFRSGFSFLFRKKFQILSIENTVQYVLDKKCSIGRYGDGEVCMMNNRMPKSFQTFDADFSERLKQVAKSADETFLVCLPYALVSFKNLNSFAKNFWRQHFCRNLCDYYKYFDNDKIYGNTSITRCYMDFEDKTHSSHYFDFLKTIWENRDIVIIEGEESRLGVGNDLFSNTNSISRILCPKENAYKKYDEIFSFARNLDKNKLILIALGATATVLAYDLHREGFQALDVGHVDIEYEWMKMGAMEKLPIKGKYVNEAKDGREVINLQDELYKSQIISIIC